MKKIGKNKSKRIIGNGSIINSKRRIFDISTTRLNIVFHDILKRADLEDKGFTIHSLRHTFATRCNENRVNAKFVQKMLGHANIDMTLNTYTHVNSDFEKSEISRLNEMFKNDDFMAVVPSRFIKKAH